MRGTVTLAIPPTATAGQLRALASLLNGFERQSWDRLAATCARMEQARVELPEELAAMLGQLAGQLRVEAAHREAAEADVERLGPTHAATVRGR